MCIYIYILYNRVGTLKIHPGPYLYRMGAHRQATVFLQGWPFGHCPGFLHAATWRGNGWSWSI